MSLTEKINNDIKEAMKAKDKLKLEALRAVKSALLLAKTEKGGGNEITEDKELKILQKLVKQRKESADIYKSQNRNDLYEKEVAEAKIIGTYLPEQMSEEELAEKIKEIIRKTGSGSMKDMGKVMGVATKELAGKADGKLISEQVRKLLS